jgi:hypothetical protein
LQRRIGIAAGGKAKDKGDYFEVSVITKDNALVDILFWDKDFVGFYCDCSYHQNLRKKLRGDSNKSVPIISKEQAEKEVRVLARINGNPNLRLGPAVFDGEIYQVELLTLNGSLVDRFGPGNRKGSFCLFDSTGAATVRAAFRG